MWTQLSDSNGLADLGSFQIKLEWGPSHPHEEEPNEFDRNKHSLIEPWLGLEKILSCSTFQVKRKISHLGNLCFSAMQMIFCFPPQMLLYSVIQPGVESFRS